MWTTTNPDDLVWAEWDDTYVAYHRPSGRTHFLNRASYELLTDYLRTPREAARLAEQFDLDIDGNPADREELDGFLERFEELGLIRRA